MEEHGQGKDVMCKSNLWDCKMVVWEHVFVHLLVALYLGFFRHFCFLQRH